MLVGESSRELGLVAGVDAVEGGVRPVVTGGTGSDNTRTDPPPKHKNNNEAQASDISRENVALSLATSNPSARLRKSTSASGLDTRTAVRQLGRAAHAERWLAALAPETLPPGVERSVSHDWTKWYRVRLQQPLQVILEVECWSGELWAHLAVTGREQPPTLVEMSFCRDVFLGDRKAIQLFPCRRERSAAGARSLHLYAPLESDTLPSFRQSEPVAGAVGGVAGEVLP